MTDNLTKIEYKIYSAVFDEHTNERHLPLIIDLLEERLNITRKTGVIILTKKDKKLISIDNVHKIEKKGLRVLFHYHCPEIVSRTMYTDLVYMWEHKYEVRKEGDPLRHTFFKDKYINSYKNLYYDNVSSLIVGLDHYSNSIRNISKIFLYEKNIKENCDDRTIIFDKVEDIVYLKNLFEITNIKKNLEFPFQENNPYYILYELKNHWFKN